VVVGVVVVVVVVKVRNRVRSEKLGSNAMWIQGGFRHVIG
jgi:hypothetical protein